MINLLSAGFSRLFKKRTFYIGVIVMALYGASDVISAFLDNISGLDTELDDIFFMYCLLVPILMAVFCPLFIGTEYSEGTMRNKIITGHKRAVIYMSNFIICAAAGLMMCAAYVIICLGLGIPLIGFFAGDIGALIAQAGCSLAMLLSVTGIFTHISLMIKSKSVSAVICVIFAFVTVLAGMMLDSLLREPEYWEQYIYDGAYIEGDENALIQSYDESILSNIRTEYVPNPFYVSGVKRQIYQFIVDFTPGGQVIKIIEGDSSPLLAGYSMLIAAVTTAAGLIIFNKKNLN